ncbi:MAG: MoxR family ATPase [Thermodesulfovibrionales bacterium]|nr:MoxR family ATPase [Thermodesulfovibrionales bacterium]
MALTGSEGPGSGLKALHERVSSVIRGKDDAIRLAVATLLARGHLLIEDVPGVGKTTLAYTLARAIDCSFQRIQFTSDLLPADIIGVNVFNSETREFEFRRGPLFANIVLADEINRTTPKTQSALLEAMNERRVSVERTTFVLEEPFMVIATQNPMEYRGTFPLPESQLDRFALHLRLGYPSEEDEKLALSEFKDFSEIESMGPVITGQDVLRMQKEVDAIRMDESVLDYIMSIVTGTREHDAVRLGASTRGGQFLLKVARALAYYSGRDFAVPDDVKEAAPHVLGHRMMLRKQTSITDAHRVIKDILEKVPVPV